MGTLLQTPRIFLGLVLRRDARLSASLRARGIVGRRTRCPHGIRARYWARRFGREYDACAVVRRGGDDGGEPYGTAAGSGEKSPDGVGPAGVGGDDAGVPRYFEVEQSVWKPKRSTAGEEWIAAIREEEHFATPDHSMKEWEVWDRAGFKEADAREKAKDARQAYVDALREKLYNF